VAEPGSKNKLSKRKLDKYLKNVEFAKLYEHGLAIARQIGLETPPESFNPVIVDFYEKVGYLPDALLNYLLLLGWALDDRTERFSRQEMVDAFSLARVNRSPASFDPLKLWAFEESYMQEVAVAEKTERVMPFLEKAGLLPDEPGADIQAYVSAIVQAAGDRIRVAGDILEFRDFFTVDEALAFDEKALAKRLVRPPEAQNLLRDFRNELAGTTDFAADSLEQLLRDFVAARDIKIGQLIHALRVATTGKAVGFGMFEILEILGRDRSVARIDRALELAAERSKPE
jgi:glutamyl-tRNA synthetase